jgi:hypothetical protein
MGGRARAGNRHVRTEPAVDHRRAECVGNRARMAEQAIETGEVQDHGLPPALEARRKISRDVAQEIDGGSVARWTLSRDGSRPTY